MTLHFSGWGSWRNSKELDTSLLIQDLNHAYGLELSGIPTEEALQAALAERINAMIKYDFGALVQLLYRIDINETRLRRLLDEKRENDAGVIIAILVIERQWQKIESRRKYRKSDARPSQKDVTGPTERGADGPTGASATDQTGDEEEKW
jgi:hypothetical protein